MDTPIGTVPVVDQVEVEACAAEEDRAAVVGPILVVVVLVLGLMGQGLDCLGQVGWP